jgi:hypothetical protein
MFTSFTTNATVPVGAVEPAAAVTVAVSVTLPEISRVLELAVTEVALA